MTDQIDTPPATTADPVTARPISYHVRSFVDPVQLRTDLTFSTNDLNSAMMEQASMLAHYGVLAASAARQVDVVKLLLENTEAAVYKGLRNEAASTGTKVTEVQLEKQVLRHPSVISIKTALNEAKHEESISKSAVEAFRHRRDMLIQVGASSRDERKGEVRISDETRRSAFEEAQEAKKRHLQESLRSHAENT